MYLQLNREKCSVKNFLFMMSVLFIFSFNFILVFFVMMRSQKICLSFYKTILTTMYLSFIYLSGHPSTISCRWWLVDTTFRIFVSTKLASSNLKILFFLVVSTFYIVKTI